MKQTVMHFSARELDELADAFTDVLRRWKPSPKDPELRQSVDLLMRLQGAAALAGGWTDRNPFDVPWVVPVIRKALQDADKVPGLQGRVKQLELQLKEAKKPAPKPKPRPKKPAARQPFPLRTAAQIGADLGRDVAAEAPAAHIVE